MNDRIREKRRERTNLREQMNKKELKYHEAHLT